MNDSLQLFFSNNWLVFFAVSIVLNVITSGIQGSEPTTTGLSKLVCGILDSVGRTCMIFAFIGFFCGNR